ncbi:hypothetical protein Pelo_3355 [Pelomyxa schiedti]|nr:hypothetical protein Pelo_3355 [Pelomyxa schiedti]
MKAVSMLLPQYCGTDSCPSEEGPVVRFATRCTVAGPQSVDGYEITPQWSLIALLVEPNVCRSPLPIFILHWDTPTEVIPHSGDSPNQRSSHSHCGQWPPNFTAVTLSVRSSASVSHMKHTSDWPCSANSFTADRGGGDEDDLEREGNESEDLVPMRNAIN